MLVLVPGYVADALPWLAGLGLVLLIWFFGMTRCPRCGRRFPKHLRGVSLRSALHKYGGRVRVYYECRGCGHNWDKLRLLAPRKRH